MSIVCFILVVEVLGHSLHSMSRVGCLFSSDWTGFVNWENLLTVMGGVVAAAGMLSM